MSNQLTDTILMIRPVAFRFNEQTAVNNYYQKVLDGLSPEELQKLAFAEFNTFVEKLKSSGIHVIVIEDTPKPDTPDSIFPNNWISFHNNGNVVLYPMFAKNRRLERRMDLVNKFSATHNLKRIIDLSNAENENKFLEGTGSLVLDRENKIAFAAISERTHPELLKTFANEMAYQLVTFTAFQTVDSKRLPIYHTNVMMCVGDGFAVVCLDSIDDKKERENLVNKLSALGKYIIEITEEQKEHFAGNMLQLKNANGKSVIVMSAAAHQSLNSDQIKKLEKYGELLYSSLDVIEAVGGGSARCMMAEVFLPKKETVNS